MSGDNKTVRDGVVEGVSVGGDSVRPEVAYVWADDMVGDR